METTLSKDVQEKLDMINWDSLKDKYGISRDTFYNNPHLASQLAYGQMTVPSIFRMESSGLPPQCPGPTCPRKDPGRRLRTYRMVRRKNGIRIQ